MLTVLGQHWLVNTLYKKQGVTVVRSVHTVCLCGLCGSENKQRLFPYTALTDWFVFVTEIVFTARFGLNIRIYLKVNFNFYKAVPSLRRSVAGLSPQKRRFDL